MKDSFLSNIDNTWTLFLDRDGVINERIIGGYVSHYDDFIFLDDVLASIKFFSTFFNRIIIVTNQQGIGKGLMTEEDLSLIHSQMLQEIADAGGNIDAVYYCPQLNIVPNNYRKPSPQMATKAANDFADIDLDKSIMVGDSVSDIHFGINAGMKTVFVGDDYSIDVTPDITISKLPDLMTLIKSFEL